MCLAARIVHRAHPPRRQRLGRRAAARARTRRARRVRARTPSWTSRKTLRRARAVGAPARSPTCSSSSTRSAGRRCRTVSRTCRRRASTRRSTCTSTTSGSGTTRRLFDLVLVAQKDYVPLFDGRRRPGALAPVGRRGRVFSRSRLPRINDVAFVGTVDAGTRPKRAAAVELLRQRFGLVCSARRRRSGSSAAAMAARVRAGEDRLQRVGARRRELPRLRGDGVRRLLLTEDIGNGLRDLFTPGEHLVVYTPESLVEQRRLLSRRPTTRSGRGSPRRRARGARTAYHAVRAASSRRCSRTACRAGT